LEKLAAGIFSLLIIVPAGLWAVQGTDWIHKHPTNWAEEVVEKYLHANSLEAKKQFLKQPELADPDFTEAETHYWGYYTTFLPEWSSVKGREIASVFVIDAMNGGRDNEFYPSGDTYYVVKENDRIKIDLTADDAVVYKQNVKWFNEKPLKNSVLEVNFRLKSNRINNPQLEYDVKFPEKDYSLLGDIEVGEGTRVAVYLKKNNPDYNKVMANLEEARNSDKESLSQLTINVGTIMTLVDGQYGVEMLSLIHVGWIE
jgi:hypothetical protein